MQNLPLIPSLDSGFLIFIGVCEVGCLRYDLRSAAERKLAAVAPTREG